MSEEDGFPTDAILREAGIERSTYYRWVRQYRALGESAFDSTRHGPRLAVHPEVSDKILSVKKAHPTFGVRRIAAVLQRMFLLPASNEAVRRTLTDAGISPPVKKARKRNVDKPRRFERSTPNQMWQSDIMMFRMGGRQLYLIGYIDDYSRFITGLKLCLAQTADNVMELYRKATAEFGVPKEMLTDNGRQYVNWRGVSKFQSELQKDRVKHIRSSPHHPMTLGKIERFWHTIFEEFLSKAQFGSFEDAQERIVMWVQYYNHKRPHQGIEGLCPADRYFEIASDVRKTIEAGVKENALELALRGKAKEPFYLVGRMDGQSVVLRARKGTLALTVYGALAASGKEQEFTIDKERNDGDGTAEDAGNRGDHAERRETVQQGDNDIVYGDAEGGSGPEDLGGASDPLSGLSGDGDHLDYFESLAGAGHGGDAAGTGTESCIRQGAGTEPPSSGTSQEAYGDSAGPVFTPNQKAGAEKSCIGGLIDGRREQGTGTPVGDHAGVYRCLDGNGRCAASGCVSQDLLRVAGTGHHGDAGCTQGPSPWQAENGGRYGEGAAQGAGGRPEQQALPCAEDDRSEKYFGRLRTAAEIAAARFVGHVG
jgi:transposase InsO family protein